MNDVMEKSRYKVSDIQNIIKPKGHNGPVLLSFSNKDTVMLTAENDEYARFAASQRDNLQKIEEQEKKIEELEAKMAKIDVLSTQLGTTNMVGFDHIRRMLYKILHE